MTATPTPPTSSRATRTPWGPSQTAKEIAPGITQHHTSGHGGYKLSRARNQQVPSSLRNPGGWYEEDAESAIVYWTFPDHFPERAMASALATLKNYWPEAMSELLGHPVALQESELLRERAFDAAHQESWLSRAAFGSGQSCFGQRAEVPAGYVGVVAARGPRTHFADISTRWFLVPAIEYGLRGEFSFVVDPARHAEWAEAPDSHSLAGALDRDSSLEVAAPTGESPAFPRPKR